MLIAFVDLERVFDKMIRQELFRTPQQVGVDFNDRQLIYIFTYITEIRIADKSEKPKKESIHTIQCHQCCLMYISNKQS